MTSSYRDIIRRHSKPLSPLPTDVTPKLRTLSDVRAVLFDIYGTLLISGSGDVGVSAEAARDDAAVAALIEVGVPDELLTGAAEHDGPASHLIAAIERNHARRHAEGTPYPEVDIVEIWRQVATAIWPHAAVDGGAVDFQRLAVEYEVRVNPVWPMPGLVDVVTALDDAGVVLGVISNAQFFTPLLFPALVDRTLDDLAFAAGMQYFSYRLGVAKPDESLYRQAAEGLGESGIEPSQILYVGNDMLNDVTPAAQCGFRTALFAGDRRSLRLREDDPRVAGVAPDLILDELASLLTCLQIDN